MFKYGSIAVLCQFSSDLFNFLSVLVLSHVCGSLLSSLVPGSSSRSSVVLQLANQISLAPSNFMSQVAQGAELPEVLQSDDFKGIWHNHSLLSVVGSWDTFEHLELSWISDPNYQGRQHLWQWILATCLWRFSRRSLMGFCNGRIQSLDWCFSSSSRTLRTWLCFWRVIRRCWSFQFVQRRFSGLCQLTVLPLSNYLAT